MNDKLKLTCAVLAAAQLAWPMASAWAQNPQGSVQDFRLEPGTPTPPSDIQGPVDADAPIRVPRPDPTTAPAQPTAAATPTPTAAPTLTIPTPSPAQATPAARPSPERTAAATTATPAPVAAPEETPAATPQPPAVPDPVSSVPEAASTNPPVTAESAATGEEPAFPVWAWIVALAVALLAAAAWFLLRRREPDAPVLLEPAPRRAAPRRDPAPAPEASAPAPAPDEPEPVPAGLSLQLTANRLSASLFMATLQYRIELENSGAESLGPIAIAGDMTAAHASRSPQEQLAAAGQELTEMHRVEVLQPGEKAELTGEIRVPLSAITPIRQGRAMLFVPLVRVHATNAGEVISGGTFVIGEPPATPGGRLRPFRLDLGPRVYPAVEQRKLASPDAMPLDGRAMAG